MPSPVVFITRLTATFLRRPTKLNPDSHVEVEAEGRGMSARTSAANAMSNLFKNHKGQVLIRFKGDKVSFGVSGELTKIDQLVKIIGEDNE